MGPTNLFVSHRGEKRRSRRHEPPLNGSCPCHPWRVNSVARRSRAECDFIYGVRSRSSSCYRRHQNTVAVLCSRSKQILGSSVRKQATRFTRHFDTEIPPWTWNPFALIVTSGEMSTPVTSHSRTPVSFKNGNRAPVPHPTSTTRVTPFPSLGWHASAMRRKDGNCCREQVCFFP